MPRRKIAVWYNVPSGGSKRQIFLHLRELLKRGWEFEAWRPPLRQEDYLPIGSLIPEHVVPLERKQLRSGPLKLLDIASRERFNLDAMEAHSRSCASEMRQRGFEFLWANTCLDRATPMIGRFFEGPKIAYVNEPQRPFYEAQSGPWPWSAPEGALSLKGQVLDRIRQRDLRLLTREERRSALSYDRFLCNSLYSRETFLRVYGVDAEVCYLGVDEALFTPGVYPREPFVLMLGSFNRVKNVELIVRALSLIPSGRPELVWVGNYGDPAYRSEMLALAESLGVNLTLKELIPDAELIRLLQTATALVYTPRLEPFGYAPLEASACGTPTVTVPEGGTRESVRDGVNGLWTEPDAASIAGTLSRLIDSPSLVQELGTQARALVLERWTASQAADRLEAAFLKTFV